MIVFDAPVTPDALTTFVREVPTPADHALSQILPDRVVNSNEVDLLEITRTNRTARFRAYDGRLHVSDRDSGSTRRVKLPPLSTSFNEGEYERLQRQFQQFGGTNLTALTDAVYNDGQNGVGEIRNRMEQARGDVLDDGKFTLAGEDGLYLEADFGVPATNLVAPSVKWSDTENSTPVEDLTTWVKAYVKVNGFRPGGMVMSNDTVMALLRNKEIRSLAASLAGAPGLVSRSTLDQVLASFNLPPIAMVYDSKVDVDGTVKDILDATKVRLLPPAGQPIGYTAWGVSATALELVDSNLSELTFSDAPGIVGVVEKVGPPYRKFTFIDAVGMPVIEQPRRLMIANAVIDAPED